jgi:hypothetical protein
MGLLFVSQVYNNNEIMHNNNDHKLHIENAILFTFY